MDSLLDRQSGQRILPDESCLLGEKERESGVQCQQRVRLSGGRTASYTSTLKSAARLTHHV